MLFLITIFGYSTERSIAKLHVSYTQVCGVNDNAPVFLVKVNELREGPVPNVLFKIVSRLLPVYLRGPQDSPESRLSGIALFVC